MVLLVVISHVNEGLNKPEILQWHVIQGQNKYTCIKAHPNTNLGTHTEGNVLIQREIYSSF